MSEPPPASPRAAKGRIITFYSYKGGTGRSMAAANVAWMLALCGNRVLVIDWDLEAPGIHRYFHPFLEDKELLESPGLLDMVENLAAHAATASEPLSTEHVDIIEYVEPLEWPRDARSKVSWKQFGERARIDLMPAGRQGPAYSRKLSTFNWIDFYERLGGKRLLEAARRQMREIYDYVLIDSRTGVSDTSGICTVEMPDTLVICFTLNEQSIRGVSAVAQSVREQRSQGGGAPAEPPGTPPSSPSLPPFRTFFVPTRVEITSERDKREIALDIAQRTFAPYLDHLPPSAHGRYWGAVQMAYFPYYAFEEIPAIFGDKPNDVLSLTTAIREVTRAITDQPDLEMPPLAPDAAAAEEIRREILGWHLRPSLRSLPAVARLAQDAYDGFDDPRRTLMMRTLLRLVVVDPSGAAIARVVPLTELDDDDLAEMARLLASRQILVVREQQPSPTVACADPSLLQEWEPLRQAIESDRRFLAWHTSLVAAVESWKQNARDESALLRGRVLDEASGWARSRRDDLSGDERDFIETSLDDAERRRAEAEAARHRIASLEAAVERVFPAQSPSPPRPWWLREWRGISIGTAIAIAVTLLSAYLSPLKKWFGGDPEVMPTPVASPTPAASLIPASTAAVFARCPDARIVTRDWMEAAGPSTFQAIDRPLVARCILETARALGPRVEEGLFGKPALRETSYKWVSAVLRANGMIVNPVRCDLRCLSAGLSVAPKPTPGMIAVLPGGAVGFELGYEGDVLRIGPAGTLVDSPVEEIQGTLELPFDRHVR